MDSPSTARCSRVAAISESGGGGGPMEGPFYDRARNARSGGARGGVDGGAAAGRRRGKGKFARLPRAARQGPARRTSPTGGPWPDLPLTRKSELIELQRRDPPFGGFAAVPLSALRRVFASPGPIYEPEGAAAGFLALGAGALCRRLPRRRPRAQHLFLSSDPGRGDGRERRRGARLPGDPRRHRPDRAAVADDRRSAAGRLCRDARPF